MATEGEVDALMKRFAACMPRKTTSEMEKTNIGIGMLLRYLAEADRPVSAGEISRYMNVSTARVAVLLRTMSEKGLILKSADDKDARKVRVSLSKEGIERHKRAVEEFRALIAQILDKVGTERVELFLAILDEINGVIVARKCEKEGN